jgi:hypothetical protein
MFFGPQKVLADYSRKKVIPICAVVASGAEAAVLKSCVRIRMDTGRCGPAFR